MSRDLTPYLPCLAGSEYRAFGAQLAGELSCLQSADSRGEAAGRG